MGYAAKSGTHQVYGNCCGAMIRKVMFDELNPYESPNLEGSDQRSWSSKSLGPAVFLLSTIAALVYTLGYEFGQEYPSGWPVIVSSFLISLILGIYTRIYLWSILCCLVPRACSSLLISTKFGWRYAQVFEGLLVVGGLSMIIILVIWVSKKWHDYHSTRTYS